MHPVCVRSSQSSELADRDRMQRLAVPLTTLRNAVDLVIIRQATDTVGRTRQLRYSAGRDATAGRHSVTASSLQTSPLTSLSGVITLGFRKQLCFPT
jgi:hypothetical protein